MIGGRIETGVAPRAARIVPKPTLMIMIWMIWSVGRDGLDRGDDPGDGPRLEHDRDLEDRGADHERDGERGHDSGRARAEEDLERRPEKSPATTSVTIQPASPARSAGVLRMRRSRRTTMTGERASSNGSNGVASTLSTFFAAPL